MKQSSQLHIILSFTVALLAGTAMLLLVSCKQRGAESKPADVDYYTCTMHPSVKSQDPDGKCPICGMGLVPVKKKSPSSNPPAPMSMESTPGMPGAKEETEKESEI